MPTLTNIVISKAYKGASGEGEYGSWQAYNFYVKDDKRKFSCFDNTLIPREGMAIVALEYEKEQSQSKKDGKWYTNNNVKTIMLPDTQETVSDVQGQEQSQNYHQTTSGATGSTQRDSSISFYVAYAKDLLVALLPHHAGYNQMELEDLGKIVTQVGMNMQDYINDKCASCPKAQPNTEPIKIPEQQPDDDYEQPPIGKPPEDIPY